MAKILITGGSGLIGMHLSDLLTDHDHEVVHLSRSSGKVRRFKTFAWNVENGTIDRTAFESVDHIVHLAGTGVTDKRWTSHRKKAILGSRINGIDLLYEIIKTENVKLKSFVSASGIGYYGSNTGDQPVNENHNPGRDFLAEVVKVWEAHADAFKTLTKVAKIRIGLVLAPEGGALPIIAKPIRYFMGASLGSGKQYMSWIHILDLCRIFQYILEKEIEGTYNAVAPNPVTNGALIKEIAKTLDKPLLFPNIPAFMLKLMLGEMSQMVLGGNNVSCEAIQKIGFNFKFTELNEALNDLLKK